MASYIPPPASGFAAAAIVHKRGAPSCPTTGVETLLATITPPAGTSYLILIEACLNYANSGGAGSTSGRVELTLDDATTKSWIGGAANAGGAGFIGKASLAALSSGNGAAAGNSAEPFGTSGLDTKKITAIKIYGTSTSNAAQTLPYAIYALGA